MKRSETIQCLQHYQFIPKRELLKDRIAVINLNQIRKSHINISGAIIL